MENRIRRFATLDSTMEKAAELASAGAATGTVVVAGEQTAGQGRLGRSWYSEPGAGLYFTEILRPKLCPASLPVVTLALGLAVAEGLEEVSGAACDLRWPNDVLIGPRKVSGILALLQDEVLLAGIGVNVNHTRFPADLEAIATSLRIASGRVFDLDAVLAVLVERIDGWMELLLEQGKEPVLRTFTQRSSYARGRRVTVEQEGGAVEGVTDGLDPQGFLYVRGADGKRRLILAGGVRPA